MSTDPAGREHTAPVSASRHRSRLAGPNPGMYKHSVAVFLGALMLFIIMSPLSERLMDSGLLEGAFLTAVMICGVLAVGGRRTALMLVAFLAVPAVGARWLSHFWPELVPLGASHLLGVLVLAVVIVQLLKFILRAPRVDSEVLSAGIATYLVLALAWMMLYLFAASIVPNAFVLADSVSKNGTLDGFHALYFSFITLCTVGYGDIVPATPFVRMLAVLESITGVLYMSVLIARLVTLYTSDRD